MNNTAGEEYIPGTFLWRIRCYEPVKLRQCHVLVPETSCSLCKIPSLMRTIIIFLILSVIITFRHIHAFISSICHKSEITYTWKRIN
jgi:hypothetical protein